MIYINEIVFNIHFTANQTTLIFVVLIFQLSNKPFNLFKILKLLFKNLIED